MDLYEQFKTGDPKSTFLSLYDARNDPDAVDKHGLQRLADAEHYAFSRGYISENPWMYPSFLLASPGYYALKKLGILDGRSEPTLEQMWSGLLGSTHGLMDYFE